MDIIQRASEILGSLVVAVAVNLEKEPLFSTAERVEMLRDACSHLSNVEVDYFDGLLVDYVKSQSARIVVKGLRAVSDFEFEFQMALMNKSLDKEVETLYMMTSAEYLFLSSRMVKELVELGASVNGLVPAGVERHLLNKLKQSAGGTQ